MAEILLYAFNKLTTLLYLVTNICKAIVWLGFFVVSMISAARENGVALIIISTLFLLSFLCTLLYASMVHHRSRRHRHSCERQNSTVHMVSRTSLSELFDSSSSMLPSANTDSRHVMAYRPYQDVYDVDKGIRDRRLPLEPAPPVPPPKNERRILKAATRDWNSGSESPSYGASVSTSTQTSSDMDVDLEVQRGPPEMYEDDYDDGRTGTDMDRGLLTIRNYVPNTEGEERFSFDEDSEALFKGKPAQHLGSFSDGRGERVREREREQECEQECEMQDVSPVSPIMRTAPVSLQLPLYYGRGGRDGERASMGKLIHLASLQTQGLR